MKCGVPTRINGMTSKTAVSNKLNGKGELKISNDPPENEFHPELNSPPIRSQKGVNMKRHGSVAEWGLLHGLFQTLLKVELNLKRASLGIKIKNKVFEKKKKM